MIRWGGRGDTSNMTEFGGPFGSAVQLMLADMKCPLESVLVSFCEEALSKVRGVNASSCLGRQNLGVAG